MDERPRRGREVDNHIDRGRVVRDTRVDIGGNLNPAGIVSGPSKTANLTGMRGDRAQERRTKTRGASLDGGLGATPGWRSHSQSASGFGIVTSTHHYTRSPKRAAALEAPTDVRAGNDSRPDRKPVAFTLAKREAAEALAQGAAASGQ